MNLRPISLHEDKTKEIYATEDCQILLSMYEEFYPKIGYHMPWVGYFVIRQDEVVGSCGFVGKPNDNKLEIAYWTFKAFEGQGIASFACKELLRIALDTDPDVRITAKTLPELNSSTRILEKNHFRFSEIVQDDEIGNAWLWVHHDEV